MIDYNPNLTQEEFYSIPKNKVICGEFIHLRDLLKTSRIIYEYANFEVVDCETGEITIKKMDEL